MDYFDIEKKIPIYDLKYLNKNQANIDLKKINEQSAKNSVIRIEILNFDNSLTGFLNSLKSKFLFVVGLGGSNKVNRFFLENTNIDFLQDPQKSDTINRIDFIHHFNSGLNHVLVALASKKKINFVFSFNGSDISNKSQAKEIGRIKQNITLINKYNLGIYFISRNYINKTDLYNFFKVKRRINLDKEIEFQSKKHSEKFISDGISFK